MDDYKTEQSKNGRKGGRTTLEKHGLMHFSKAGKKSRKLAKKRQQAKADNA